MDLQRVKEDANNGSLISTGTWRKILAYALELERIDAEREIELSSLLPSPYYMDLPDGGDTTVIEQLRRMAEDAKNWRDCVASTQASPNWKLPVWDAPACPKCAMCSDLGIVGNPPDNYFNCPDCTLEARAPQGWKLVPLHPNQQMINAFITEYEKKGGSENGCYHAMIAAAPTVQDAPALPSWKLLVDAAIEVLRRQIVPDGISDSDVISELHGIFDGPVYRSIRNSAVQDAPACAKCGGSGETTAMSGSGPDAYEVPVNCQSCGGTGAQ